MSQLSMFEREAETKTRVVVFREMRVNRLTLRNFKKFAHFEITPDGRNLIIYGDNETGKTTLADAFMWLFFDKDSLNKKDFGIKTLVDGEPLHRLEHEVEGEVTVGGVPRTFKKVYREKWTKKRGSPVESFTGHETLYYVDGVPKSETEYKKAVSKFLDEKVFRLLSDPRYFNEQLHWTERRKILLDICGDLTDEEVIASDERLSALTEIVAKRTIEEHKKVLSSSMSKINKELKEIPARVNEVQRLLPDVSGTEPELVKSALREKREERQEKADELSRLEQGAGVAEKTAELRTIQSKMMDMESSARRQLQDAEAEKRRALSESQAEYSQREKQYKNLLQLAEDREQEAANLDKKLDELCAEWEAIDAEEFTYCAETVCPTCNQDLPEDQIEEARQKALEAFNQSKAERLEENERQGHEIVKRKKALESDATKYRNEAALQQKKMQQMQARYEKIQSELSKMPSSMSVTDPEYNRLAMRRETLTREIEELKEGTFCTLPLKQELSRIDAVIAGLEQQLARWQQRKQGEKRIEELCEREKELTAEYERMSQEMFLIEEFQRVQARALEEKVASKFRYVRFRLFEEQVNGGLAETCETLYKGVPYSKGLNNGAKIQAGLDIINTLQEHYGFVVPIWLDNRESVTWIPETKAQVISLIVSPEDKTLRIEYPQEEVQ